MGIAEVKAFFREKGLEDKIREHDESSATVELAAEALGTEPARIAKTMSFSDRKGSALIVVMAGDVKVDNRKFKDFFKMKAKMLTPDEVEEFTGHPIGGVCPFALRQDIPVYCDKSMLRFETLHPACGSRNSSIELTPEEIYEYSEAVEWIDVTKEA